LVFFDALLIADALRFWYFIVESVSKFNNCLPDIRGVVMLTVLA
jgi:hypothetical protein